MLKLLPMLKGPYFDFLVFPAGQCWERRGSLKRQCFHHPDALRVQDVIVSVFVRAFEQSHSHFNYYGPTEYIGVDLHRLQKTLAGQIQVMGSCRTHKQFQAKLNKYFTASCDEELGIWLPKWRRMRNELEVIGQEILHRVEQAEREQKALLALGI